MTRDEHIHAAEHYTRLARIHGVRLAQCGKTVGAEDADGPDAESVFHRATRDEYLAEAEHHVKLAKSAAGGTQKAAGLADSGDAIAPMPGISVIAEPPQGLRLIRRAGGPDVPVAASTDEVFDKIFGGDAL